MVFSEWVHVLVTSSLCFFFLLTSILLMGVMRRKKALKKDGLKVVHLNKKFQKEKSDLLSKVMEGKDLKAELKLLKKKLKSAPTQKVFVYDFDGDMAATKVDALRSIVNHAIQVLTEKDEMVVRLESPGGMVHGYGLAASQLKRLKDHKIPLTVCVDKVAASGGYLMACVADKILAAPFAYIGSIGVVANVPNFNKVLKKHDVDYIETTAGEYKRTVTLFGEVSEKGKAKFKEQVEDTHDVFKEFVESHRPHMNMAEVATGEYWLAKMALEKKLVDALMPSDDYIFTKCNEAQVYQLSFSEKHSVMEKLSSAFSASIEKSILKVLTKLQTPF